MNLDGTTVFTSQVRVQSIDYLILVAYRFFFDLKDQNKDFWTSDLSSDIFSVLSYISSVFQVNLTFFGHGNAGGSCHWSWLALPGSKSKTLGLFEGRGNGRQGQDTPKWEERIIEKPWASDRRLILMRFVKRNHFTSHEIKEVYNLDIFCTFIPYKYRL